MAITFRTDSVVEEALERLAEVEGISKQEVLRRAVMDRLDQFEHDARVNESAQRMLEKWGDVLQRLGEA